MATNEMALIAHLMRRAGFGTTRGELEELMVKGYEAVVDDLLHPERFPDIEEDVLKRYYLELTYLDSLPVWTGRWLYRMINTQRPLVEKITLFWHQVLATAWYKSEHSPTMIHQIEMFRRVGLSDTRTILMELARDPAMNYWLDNCENHSNQPNENWGRELLELFSMGVGNYSEEDIKNASRAFTGWTFTQPIPLYPYGNYPSRFKYIAEDHDGGDKTFLGESGAFNGENIIDIIVKQPATARFVSRHLYNFFVADEPQIPAWELEPPQDMNAIEILEDTYIDSGGNINSMLRVLFNSDFFKESMFKKVKSPVELVASTIKLVGTYKFPEDGITQLGEAPTVMGQQLMNPPTVEGWHTGKEWIDGGTLNERINFAVNQLNDIDKPGIQDIISRIQASNDSHVTPNEFVHTCLDLVGPLEVKGETYDGLLKYANSCGELLFNNSNEIEMSGNRIKRMLQLIVASREYQFE